jgi:hypothetical protein
MSAWSGQLRPSPPADGLAGRVAARRGAVRPARALAVIALTCVALGVVLHGTTGRASAPFASGVSARPAAQAGLSSLSPAAEGPVSAALGRDDATYRINGLAVRNPAQRFSARFGRSGVTITTSAAKFNIGLKAFGRGAVLRTLPPVSPVASANGVGYAYGSMREWWANGPAGLEQGFDIASRPAGSGALAFSLAVPGGVRLSHGVLLLPGGLRYAGVRAADARGRALPAWLTLNGARAVLHVSDRGARYPLRIDPFVQQTKLSASDGADADEFGYSVAVSGSTVVVGAPHHAVGSHGQQGAVYVFASPGAGASMTQTAELTDSGGKPGEELGYSVAISGDTIAAGEPGGTELPGNQHKTENELQGTVDVFTTSGSWTTTATPTARLTDSGTQSTGGGEFGWSVAISSDAKTIVAGAPDDGTPGDEEGRAFVFVTSSTWASTGSPTAQLAVAVPTGEELFGRSVAISGTAGSNNIVVGAPLFAPAGHQQGAAYEFTEPGGGWATAPNPMNQTAKLTANDSSGGDQLGYSVGISGGTIVAGAPFHAVGANPGQGAAYVFVTSGVWPATANQSAELTTPGPGNELGFAVATTGSTIVAGAPPDELCSNDDQGGLYTFTEPGGGWSASVAAPALLMASDGGPSDELGNAAAISGTTIVGGAYRHEGSAANHGAAYVFNNGGVSNAGCGFTPTPTATTTPTATPTPTSAPTPTASVTAPTVKVASVSGGHAKITAAISCPAGGPACPAVELQATVTEHLKGSTTKAISASGKKTAKPKTKRVVIAAASTILAAGATKTITIKLNSTGLALLKKFGKLKAIVTVISGGKTIGTVTVTVQKQAKPK